jgi:hypothetical protein
VLLFHAAKLIFLLAPAPIPTWGQKLTFGTSRDGRLFGLRKDPMEVLAIKQKPHKPFEELCPRIWGLVAEANSSFKGLLFAGLLI